MKRAIAELSSPSTKLQKVDKGAPALESPAAESNIPIGRI